MTAAEDLAARYHGIHPAAPQAGYERIDWQKWDARVARVRVRDHTCECQVIVYELCQAGGLLVVRRLYRSEGVAVHRSEWLRAAEAERLWMRILLGQAR